MTNRQTQSPLSSLVSDEPALVVDSSCCPDALYSNAEVRLAAVRELMVTVTLAAGNQQGADSLSAYDVANVAHAAQLLTSDALDLMAACQEAHARCREQHDKGRVQRFTTVNHS